MRIGRRLCKFVQKTSVGLRVSDRRFVGDVVRGLVQRGLKHLRGWCDKWVGAVSS